MSFYCDHGTRYLRFSPITRSSVWRKWIDVMTHIICLSRGNTYHGYLEPDARLINLYYEVYAYRSCYIHIVISPSNASLWQRPIFWEYRGPDGITGVDHSENRSSMYLTNTKGTLDSAEHRTGAAKNIAPMLNVSVR